jgi:outer membrane protein OmpA-like peptidoglycan-associated protein
MARLLLLLLLILSIEKTDAQNLLANSSFEDRNTCTELHAVCAPEGWFRIPLEAVSVGKGTAGFFLGSHHENMVMENVMRPGIFRTYIYTKLLCPLEKGREYVFTTSLRAGNNNEPFGHLDLLWLDFEPFHYQARVARAKEKITITDQQKTKDQKEGWKEYAIRFTATGDEQYLLMGNFAKETFPGKPQQRSLIIYEIDNVSLLPVDPSFKACAERDENKAKLYLHNYRHTAGKFLDEDEVKQPAGKEDTPLVSIPALPKPAEPVVNDTLVIPDVLFKFDKSELNPVFAYRLDTLINKIKNRTFKRIEVLGHTDSFGTDEYNQKLSQNRAETVKRYLMDHLHYPSDNIIAKGFAASVPVSTNATSAGRQKNRRVEIVLVK